MTSASSFRSDSWIDWKPRIDEPSNICPPAKKSASTDSTGTLKCCITPGKSQKRTSRNLMLLSLMYLSASSAVLSPRLDIDPPGNNCAFSRDFSGLLLRIVGCDFNAVSHVFRVCYSEPHLQFQSHFQPATVSSKAKIDLGLRRG